MVLAITYTDRVGAASGDVEIKLEDSGKVWQGPWYPQQGDVITLSIGYRGEAQLPCGSFQVDELELTGPPDVFHLRCLAAYITPAMRTTYSTGYEGQTLTQIASTIASKYSLTPVSEADKSDPVFERVTQSQESDLAFLRRLALEHDYDFTVRGSQLVFYSRSALEGSAPVSTINRGNVLAFAFNDRSYQIYENAEVAYQMPFAKALINQNATSASAVPTTDTAKRVVRCENGQQAELKANSLLHGANMLQMTARLSCSGNTLLAAGNVVTVAGFGAYDGNYIIDKARHHLTHLSGYTTEIDLRSVPALGTAL
jgi:uncharacterized protein